MSRGFYINQQHDNLRKLKQLETQLIINGREVIIVDLKEPKKQTWYRYLNPFIKQIEKYGNVPSFHQPEKGYTVIKRSNLLGSKYSCTCPDHFFRQRECKHIQLFKEKE